MYPILDLIYKIYVLPTCNQALQDHYYTSFSIFISGYTSHKFSSFAWLPVLPEQYWSGWEVCLIFLSRIDQPGKGCLICLSRIDLAERAAWFAWAGLIWLRRGAWFAWEGLIWLRGLPDLPEQDWSAWEGCLICMSRIFGHARKIMWSGKLPNFFWKSKLEGW